MEQKSFHSEKEFVKELSKSTFKVPKSYSFDHLYDEDDALDGATLIFDLDKKDINLLIDSAKKVAVDWILIEKLDKLEDAEEEIYCGGTSWLQDLVDGQ